MDTTLQIIVDFVGAVIGGFIGVKLFYLVEDFSDMIRRMRKR